VVVLLNSSLLPDSEPAAFLLTLQRAVQAFDDRDRSRVDHLLDIASRMQHVYRFAQAERERANALRTAGVSSGSQRCWPEPDREDQHVGRSAEFAERKRPS
jgi:hypothetical protein